MYFMHIRLTQPVFMRRKRYDGGAGIVNGNDLWALFLACTHGDLAKTKQLLAKDPRLINAQFWYQCPLHPAVREGHERVVRHLLKVGTDAGRSAYLYNAWGGLLEIARERGRRRIEEILLRSIRKRFKYHAEFDRLREAIESRELRKVKAVVRRQPELLRATDIKGNNALHWSVITRQLKLIDYFVEQGTPIEAQRADLLTPAMQALSWWRPLPEAGWLRNRWVVVGHLLAHGAEYPLPLAAAVGDQERVEAILAQDPAAAFRTDPNMTGAITYAAREGHTHIVKLLLDHWPRSRAHEHRTPLGLALFFACWSNHLETAKLLLEHGADPNAGADSCGCCLTIGKAYHGAAAKPVQRLLRKHGAHDPPYDMNAAQLRRAIRQRHEVTKHDEFLGNVMRQANAKLIDEYIDFNPRALKNMHHWGGNVLPSSPALVRRLIKRGLAVRQTDWMGSTFLHHCAEKFDTENAAVLLEHGADINAVEIEHRATPLAAAVRSWRTNERERKAMVKFLLQRGAATDLSGAPDWATPLSVARKRGLAGIESILIRHGATR